VCLVVDWLTTLGGAERVIAAMRRVWPDAPVFTTVLRRDAVDTLGAGDVRVSGLQTWYELLGKHQLLLPWMPQAVESFDLREFDVVISSSHAVAKGCIPPSTAVHVCYCHTPMRYAWDMAETYLDDFHIPSLLRPLVRWELQRLRRWDRTTAQRVDTFLANSTTTAGRIERHYARPSTVLPPPVEARFFDVPLAQPAADAPFLAAGRFVPYKRFDLLISVANERQLPLRIIGRGPDEAKLRAMAGPTVEFLGYVPDADLPQHLAGARGFLFPQLEDAGIILLEAMATGTPALAFQQGGATDAVIDGVTGLFFAEQTVASLCEALDRCHTHAWDRAHIREQAQRFHVRHFEDTLRAQVEMSFHTFRRTR
jgi:glycosyltransferase involved in cell wall biosynthesis